VSRGFFRSLDFEERPTYEEEDKVNVLMLPDPDSLIEFVESGSYHETWAPIATTELREHRYFWQHFQKPLTVCKVWNQISFVIDHCLFYSISKVDHSLRNVIFYQYFIFLFLSCMFYLILHFKFNQSIIYIDNRFRQP